MGFVPHEKISIGMPWQLGATLLIFSGVCSDFQRFCEGFRDFAQISTDFHQIKTFGSAFAPLPPTPVVQHKFGVLR